MGEQKSRRTLGIPDSRSGSYLNLESELISLRRALKTTSGSLLVRVPLFSENYIQNVQGWRFELSGNVEINNLVARGTIEANGIFTGTLGASTVNAISINANQITAGFLNVDRLQVNSINGNRISDGSIGGGKIADATISAAKIENLTITADKIANLTITGGKIANATISSAKIVSLAAEKISAGTITSVGLSQATNITTLGLTVSVSAASFQAGLTSTTGAFSSVLSNAGMPASTDFGLPTVQRRADNVLVRFTSSARYKKNIVPVESPSAVLDLELRKYDALDDSSFNQVGLIAEEVDALGLSPLVKYDSEGRPDGVSYELVGAMLAPHVKALEARVAALEEANGQY